MIDVRLRFSSRARVKQIAEIPMTFCCPACGIKLTVAGSLAGGKAKLCTVVLRWNTEDQPAYPYLEAVDLKTMDWNP
jgi:hypothetical protein